MDLRTQPGRELATVYRMSNVRENHFVSVCYILWKI